MITLWLAIGVAIVLFLAAWFCYLVVSFDIEETKANKIKQCKLKKK